MFLPAVEFTQATINYWASTANLTDHIESSNSSEEILSTKFQTSWEQAEKNLSESFMEIPTAEAKLLLLGEGEGQRLVREYGEYVSKFLAESFYRTPGLKLAEVMERKTIILKKRKAIFDNLSSVYKRGRT